MKRLVLLGLLAAGLGAGGALADDIYRPGGWSAMASDQVARGVGDSLTVVVNQNSVASNTARSEGRKGFSLFGRADHSSSGAGTAQLSLDGSASGSGETGRSDRLVAEISVVVTAVLPNGDLMVQGEQVLYVNGQRTVIKVQGHVRPLDISAGNTVPSNRLADARIDYNGSGFVARSGKPGLIGRLFDLFGLL